MTLTDPDDDDDDDQCTALVAVLQKDRRKKRKEGLDLLTIGYVIYKVSCYYSYYSINVYNYLAVFDKTASLSAPRQHHDILSCQITAHCEYQREVTVAWWSCLHVLIEVGFFLKLDLSFQVNSA